MLYKTYIYQKDFRNTFYRNLFNNRTLYYIEIKLDIWARKQSSHHAAFTQSPVQMVFRGYRKLSV